MPPWSASAQPRLLVVAPHPDDETLGCGLLIQQVLTAGGAVHVVLLTDGDNNPWPQRYLERRLHIDAAARRRWGLRRRQEVLQAMDRLGLPSSALRAFGWQDMGVTARLRDDAPGSVADLRSVMQAFAPTVICCPVLGDSHPDHGAAHVLCRLAIEGLPLAPEFMAYPVHGSADEHAHPIRIDASAEQQRRKLQALAEHGTQMVLSAARMRRLAQGPERYVRANDAVGGARLPWHPPAILKPWLRLLVVTAEGARDWRWPEAPLERDADGGYRWSESAISAGSGLRFVKLHLDWPSPWIFDHWGWHAL
jgi:LmbE family N-acetylglucosaminyl deacetylase